jgi:hypothetical protein
VTRPAATRNEKQPEGGPAKDRYAALIESLVQEEIKQRERALLSDWRRELGALRTGSS